MANDIRIKVEGLDKLKKAFDQFPQEIQLTIQAAGEEAAKEVLKTEGLQKYPPATAANLPPPPYYIRGEGMMYKWGLKKTSEKLGTKWYVKPGESGWKVEIGNPASYAPQVVGNEQQAKFARIGWRKLFDVATEKLPKITEIYQKWVNRLINKLGL
jgi:hypothetical protein